MRHEIATSPFVIAAPSEGTTTESWLCQLRDWNDTQAEFPDESCIHELFEAQVERTPDEVALLFDGRILSYRQLNERANQLAHYLRELGVGTETLVGLAVERSPDSIVGLLGILKAGGAYIPMDPAYPKQRLAFILEDSGLSVLLTQEPVRRHLPESQAAVVSLDGDEVRVAKESMTNPAVGATADSLAYVIYTSGSTGSPKGVAMTHRPLSNLTTWQQKQSTVGAGGRTLQLTSLSFDVSVQEVFATLCTGGALVLVQEELRRDAKALLNLIEHESIERIFLPFSPLQQLAEMAVREHVSPPTLREIITAGEQLRITPQIAAWLQQLQGCALYNQYGPTETHVVLTSFQLEGSPEIWPELPPIGRPIANAQVHILDEDLQPVSLGATGELYLGGVCLARGYLNRPELTAERFIADPFSDRPGARLYRSGDIGRYMPDGTIEFLGRVDDQVKIRGFRVELGEIEAALSQHANVLHTTVAAGDDAVGDKRLAAYVVPVAERMTSTSELRRFLLQRLPDYMVPSVFISLDSLPLSPSGKVDRKALPSVELTRPVLENTYLAPQSSIECSVASIWAEVLGLQRVGISDNFFEMGGDSLKATRVLARVSVHLRVEISHSAFFAGPTIAEMAACIEAAPAASIPTELDNCALAASEEFAPLTFGQEGIWVAAQLRRSEPIYNESFTVHMAESVNAAALEKAFNAFIERHEILRTGFVSAQGEITQRVHQTASLRLGVVDLRSSDEAARASQFAEQAGRHVRCHFDMVNPPLLRATLFQLHKDQFRLHLVFHHIICDAYSIYEILLPELDTLYRAFLHQDTAALKSTSARYGDYVHWQRAYLTGGAIVRDQGYWEEQLAELRPLELPTDRPRPPECSGRGAYQAFAISKQLADALAALSQREGVTLYMLLLAVFNVLLWRYTRQEDIAIGTMKLDRPRPEFESIFGYFICPLVMRTNLVGNPRFTELLSRVRNVAVDAYAHYPYPFTKLVEHFEKQRDPSRHPLFQVAFVMEPSLTLPPSGWSVSQLDVQNGTAKFDLTLEVEQRPEGIIGRFEYSTDLFEQTTIERLVGHYQTMLEGVVESPARRLSELRLLTDAERQQLLVEWSATSVPYPKNKCIHELFEAQVEQSPEAVALVGGDRTLSYRDLNARANQLAHYLRGLGVVADVLVGLCMQRSLDMVVAILGILKAGGAYVPLEPSHPSARLKFMLEDTQTPVLLTEAALCQQLPPIQARVVCVDTDWARIGQEPKTNPLALATAQSLAYVMYTSGSTGSPKGVAVPHQSVVRLVRGADYVDFGPEHTHMLLAPISFDASTFELWGALLNGAKCVVFAERVPCSQSLGRALSEYGITTLWLTAALFNNLIDETPEIFAGLKQLLTGGEALSLPHVRRALARLPGTALINGYGPTEGTTFTCCYHVPHSFPESLTSVPIGRPISNTQVYVLDANGNPVPILVPGELYIGGDGLACGYVNQPGLTEERFIANPFSGDPDARLYRTGDRVRYLVDGNIEFLGRLDDQVKIRGFRIEPGEIQATLLQHPAVNDAVVVTQSNDSGRRLAAYVVPGSGNSPAPLDLLAFLRLRLPDYMVPSACVLLERLPLTPNGKVDRGALPAPGEHPTSRVKAVVAPCNAIEVQLMRIWEQLLGTSRISMEDNFFDLGGHSLLAVQMMDRIKQLFDRQLPLDVLWYGHGTIRHLAQMLMAQDTEPVWAHPVAIKPSGSKPPLFCLPIAGGHLFNYDDLARYIDAERPVYGLPLPGVDGRQTAHTSVETMAAHCIEQMRGVQRHGPYHLTGYCSGGVTAFEMARQLHAQGDEVAFLGMIDSVAPGFGNTFKWMFFDLLRGKDLRLVQERVYALLLNGIRLPGLRKLKGVGESHRWALWSYRPRPVVGRITVFRPANFEYSGDSALGWALLADDGVEVQLLPGKHRDLVKEPGVQRLAESVNRCLAAITASAEKLR